ncbi:hypothetical protein IFM89_014974 [Coptis chinensis]|uniref:Uncharacterized protein n=1 Tax=Coptis chinensis TaxID=261450 RepID=A0A835HK68_9MAGN|nr:hypothetical protein IFM89_014974 [Coptis chinensis]
MSNNEGPKLYATKPKKSQVKQYQQTASTTAPNPMEPPTPTPPPSSAANQSFARRYKYVWPLLLTVNLGIGELISMVSRASLLFNAYLFLRTNKKEKGAEDGEVAVAVPSTPVANTTAPVPEGPPPPPRIEPVTVREPIPEDKQREIFKWMLEEKRKVKPSSPEEKKRLDEEKAILKQFIRGKSIPSL